MTDHKQSSAVRGVGSTDLLGELSREVEAFVSAALRAQKFLKQYHWNDNRPRRVGCWDLEAAKDAYEALDKVVVRASVRKLKEIKAVDEIKDGGRY